TYLVHDENSKNSVKYKIQVNCDILYNGRAIESVIDTHVFVPKTGDVKLVDNNNDGKYDVIFVSEYTAMIVDNVNIKEMTIYDKHDSERNIKIDIPFENVMVKDENGKMIKLEDIQKNNVVFVGWSLEKTTLELLVSKQKVTGVISNIKKAGERKYITVDNKEYPLSKNMDKNKIENLKLGESGKFYLDKNGAIFDGEKMDKQEYQIGYLLNATISNDLNEKMELKILTLSNDIKIFDVDDRILIDGVKYSKKKKLAYDSLLDGGRIRRTPIYYTINAENKVTMLDTPYIKNPKDNELKDSIHQYMDTNGNVVFKYGLKSLDAKILLDTQTIVFIEPANADDEEAYFVTNLYYFKNDLSYNGRAYTDVEDFDYAKIVSIRGTASSIDWGSGLHLISDICTSLNEEGDSVLKVQTYIGQTKNEYCFKDETVLKGKELEVGDLIILHADSKGKIDNMEFIYDESENKYYTDKAFDPESFGARHRLIFAPVIEKVGDIVKFSTDGNGKNPDNSNLELYDASKFPIVVFNRKTKKVEEVKGSGEIVTTKNDPENASMVSVYMTWANPISMYIYND
ncbi:MAG: hypothetical protein RR957_02395, partial [Oscillospiraceae bacterium]